MNTKLLILMPMLLLFSREAYGQSVQQSVQKALDNNESLKSQKVLLDNSYQNFLIQNGKSLPNLSLNSTGSRSSNFETNQGTDSYSISINSSYMLYDFGTLNAKKRSFQSLYDA
ncbi:TolC family protein, partial [Paracoccaceae bacterium]|nr:TolC family protein [Paracoccaceae bacterium]